MINNFLLIRLAALSIIIKKNSFSLTNPISYNFCLEMGLKQAWTYTIQTQTDVPSPFCKMCRSVATLVTNHRACGVETELSASGNRNMRPGKCSMSRGILYCLSQGSITWKNVAKAKWGSFIHGDRLILRLLLTPFCSFPSRHLYFKKGKRRF